MKPNDNTVGMPYVGSASRSIFTCNKWHRPIIYLMPLLLLLNSSGFGFAQEKKTTLTTLSGETKSVTVNSISSEGLVEGDGFEPLDLANVSSIRTEVKEEKPTVKYVVRLAGGGQIHAKEITVADGYVNCKSTVGQFKISVGAVRAILYKPFKLSDKVTDAIKNPSNESDQVVAESSRGQQVVSGLVEGVTKEKVSFNFRGKTQTIGIEKVVAIIMADLQEKPSDGTATTIKLQDSSVVRGTIKSLNKEKFVVGLLGNTTLELPTGKLVSIAVRSDRLTYLSDLTPIDFESQPIVLKEMELGNDTSVKGNPITLYWPDKKQTRVFNRGIGLHSYSRVVYTNEGFHKLVGVCGIDRETNGNGDCDVIIRGDGIELWRKNIKATESPSEIDINISEYSEIEIIVEPGKHLDLADHVDIGDARFLKTK